jgi:sodium/bile acid cotransporter 7
MILLPLAVGKIIRDTSARVRAFLKRHKQLVSNTSAFFLCLIPWMKLSESNEALRSLSWEAVLGLLACGIVIHLIYLVLNYSVSHWVLGASLALKKAIVVMGSQKTLPMAMTVLAFFPPSLGEQGLIAIPCIVTHLTQIFMDAFLVAKWAGAKEKAPPRALLRDEGRWRCVKHREPEAERERVERVERVRAVKEETDVSGV